MKCSFVATRKNQPCDEDATVFYGRSGFCETHKSSVQATLLKSDAPARTAMPMMHEPRGLSRPETLPRAGARPLPRSTDLPRPALVRRPQVQEPTPSAREVHESRRSVAPLTEGARPSMASALRDAPRRFDEKFASRYRTDEPPRSRVPPLRKKAESSSDETRKDVTPPKRKVLKKETPPESEDEDSSNVIPTAPPRRVQPAPRVPQRFTKKSSSEEESASSDSSTKSDDLVIEKNKYGNFCEPRSGICFNKNKEVIGFEDPVSHKVRPLLPRHAAICEENNWKVQKN